MGLFRKESGSKATGVSEEGRPGGGDEGGREGGEWAQRGGESPDVTGRGDGDGEGGCGERRDKEAGGSAPGRRRSVKRRPPMTGLDSRVRLRVATPGVGQALRAVGGPPEAGQGAVAAAAETGV